MTVKILYVEDNKMNFLLVKKILSVYDVILHHAENGEKAVNIAEQEKPDLVLMDLHLPGLDGFQVIEQMRETPDLKDVPIILLTATSFADDLARRRSGQIIVRRPDGLRPLEVLRCIGAVADALQPRYGQSAAIDTA